MDNKYEDISVIEILSRIENKTLLLPEIQRKFVWEPNDIEMLFESIVDDYPIGTCIFWKTSKKILNKEKPNLYFFLTKCKKNRKGSQENDICDGTFDKDEDYYIVLDGQQRITSFNIALKGSLTIKKSGKGYTDNAPKSWKEMELYYNLDFKNTNEKDEEHPEKRFIFLTQEEAKNGNFYKVKQILESKDILEFTDSIQNITNKEAKENLVKLFNKIKTTGIIHYFNIINADDYDKALDIFVKVNSTGKPLSKTDLLFSTLINGWENGRSKVNEVIETIRSNGFNFTEDNIMRTSLILTSESTTLNIKSLSSKTIIDIRDNWDRITNALENMSILLKKIGLTEENLTSKNATIPITLYFYLGGKFGITDQTTNNEFKKFLAISMLKQLFGVASDTTLKKTKEAVSSYNCKSKKFNMAIFDNITLTASRNFKVSEEQIDEWLDTCEKGSKTFLLLSLLCPEKKLGTDKYHQDHCHPYSSFETKKLKKIKISDEKIEEWQFKRNLLPNLEFLPGDENESKNCTPLKEWVQEKGNDFEYHPKNISLELKDFDNFFENRREMMKNELMKIFGAKKQKNKK